MKPLKQKLKQKGYILILASKSKRRQKLLKTLNLPFLTKVAKVKEHFHQKNIRKELIDIALKKAKHIKTLKKALIIAGDTVIVYNSRVFGKPKNRSEAQRFLKLFSGKTHQVLTGLVVYDTATKKIQKAVVKTIVTFKKLTEKDIASYLNTKEYTDKAGAYGIQGKGKRLIKKINGDYYNVVGLPLRTLVKLLRRAL